MSQAEDTAVKGILNGSATQGLCKRITESAGNTKLEFLLVQPVEGHSPSGPKAPSEDWVHILVVTPEGACHPAYFDQFNRLIASVVKHLYEMDDLFGDLERMEGWHALPSASPVYSVFVAWSALTMEMKNLVSPADTAKNPAFMKGTAENLAAWDRYGPLTALFSEHLAILRHELEESDQFPNPICATCTRQLIEGSARFYDSGAERETALQPILRKLISGKAYWQARLDNKLARPDGVWIEEHFAYVVVEIKNESESAGDLILQGLAVYSKILAQDKVLPGLRLFGSSLMCPI